MSCVAHRSSHGTVRSLISPVQSVRPDSRYVWLPRRARVMSTSSRPLVYPERRSDQHQDLPSFLAYAQRVGLDTKSSVYNGIHYEYTVSMSLAKYGFSLQRQGGSGDRGIDLIGTWKVPSSSQPVRVLVQCKAVTKSVSPQYVRELGGTRVSAAAGWRDHNVLVMLVASRPATKGVREALGTSREPLAYVSCSKVGHVEQMLWNSEAQTKCLTGIGIASRHGSSSSPDSTPELVLTWKDKPISPQE